MIVKFNDRSEMYVTKEEGEKIRQALTRSETGFLTVRGTTFKKTAIAKLEEGGRDPNQQPNLFDSPADRKRLEQGACRSIKPINLEIIHMATREGNPKLLKDKAWRQKAKDFLRATGNWCDRETGECACPPLHPATNT